MKRIIRDTKEHRDAYDIAWEEKFGPDEAMKFDSLEEFHAWLKEVEEFDPIHN